jgi:hypothetical protein
MDFCDQARKYSCILWRIDREVKAEDGAVFGIWGEGGPHNTLTFRVVARRKNTNRSEFPCLQNKTTERLVQFFNDNKVYMASKKQAEEALCPTAANRQNTVGYICKVEVSKGRNILCRQFGLRQC